MNDLISRKQAIDVIRAMQTYKLFAGDDLILVDKAGVMTELMMLPSAQPERKKGKWIDRNGNIVSPFWERYECSECGARSDNTNYCPNCGADMEGDIV